MSDARFEGFKSGYKWLFRLPGSAVMFSSTLLALTLLTATARLFGFSTAEVLRAAAVLALPYSTAFLADRKVLTPRRLLGLFIIYLLLQFVIMPLRKPLLLASVPVALLSLLVFVAVSTKVVLALFFTTYLAVVYLLEPFHLPVVAGAMAAYLLIAVPVLYNIDRRVRKVTGVGGLRFLNSFLRYTLSGEKAGVESCLKAFSSMRTLPLHVFEFSGRGRTLGRIVVSGIHPGPLRTLGSSTLPEDVIARCPDTVFLKAPAGHGENLADSGEAVRVAEAACSKASAGEDKEALWARVSYAEGELVDCVALSFENGVTLCMLDPQVPMEDLPSSLREEFEKEGVVLADLHNMISDNYVQLPENPGENPELYLSVVRTVREALTNTVAEGALKFGIARVDYSDGVSVSRGGVSCAVLEVGGRRVAVVSVDGNNMVPEFKALVRQRMASMADYMLIATTDTHVMTGNFQGVDYYPVGSIEREALAEKLVACLSYALGSLQECSVRYRVVPIRSLFMDGAKLRDLSRVTKLNVRDGLILALLAALSPLPLLLLP